LLLSVCLFSRFLCAQDQFTVIKVSGKIVIERTGSSLGIGTSFAQNENLLFKIPESRAAVINPQRGRFLITSNNISEFRNSKSNFLPSPGKTSTRAILVKKNANDLKEQFEGNYVILKENTILIDTAFFPLNEKKFFYLTYDSNDKPINKKLDFSKDTLFIRKNDLLTVNGVLISNPQIKQMRLVYLVRGKSDVSATIATFTPIFPDPKTMADEVRIIIDQMKANTYREKFNEISAFINEFYGKLDDGNLRKWLRDNFGLRQ